MTMKISQNGIKFIEKWEGKRNEVYKDVADLDTIGIGHLIKKNEHFPQKITDLEVYELFKKDIAIYENAINNLVKIKLNQNEFDALVSFTFNIGVSAFQKSTLLKLLNRGKKEIGSHEFIRWIYAGSKPCQGLINRRNAEKALFIKK